MTIFKQESKRMKGFGTLNVFAFLVCLCALGIMVLSMVHYKNSKNRLISAYQQQEREEENIYFWEPLYVSPDDVHPILNQAMKTFSDYMERSPDIASKASHLSEGYKQIGKMTSYYSKRPYEVLLQEPKVKSYGFQYVHGKECLMIILQFKNGISWDLVFYKDSEGVWKLDWPSFVKYQDMDWDQFILGDGVFSKGLEFRVWAQRDRTAEDDEHYAVQFTAPPHPGTIKTGISSPVVLIPKKSETGRQFYKYYRINELMNPGLKTLSATDPSEKIRMRVVLSKEKGNSANNVFKLEKIISEGWYGDPPE